MVETDKFLVANIRQYLNRDNPRLGEGKLIQELFFRLFKAETKNLIAIVTERHMESTGDNPCAFFYFVKYRLVKEIRNF